MPQLTWIGKDKVINHHTEVPYHVLRKKYDFQNTDSENKIIHGDNLLALKSLLPKYENRIKCIYIDPPYNTGNEGWVYNDNVNAPEIQKWLGKVVGKEAEDLTRHDKWLCMMYPRLVLLRKLLSEDGAIFISIDNNEQANLKLICDEIFGKSNFVGNVIWEKKFSPQNDAKYFSDNHDFIVVYTKKKENWNRNLLPRTAEQDKRFKNPDNDPRGAWTSGDLSVKTYSESYDYEIETPSGKIVNPPNGACWRVSKDKFEELKKDNRIWFGKYGGNVPRLKRFLSEVQNGVVPLTIWKYQEVGHNQTAKQDLKKLFPESKSPFDTPKPPSLIEHILKIATDKDSIVLDSFAGSGTTAHAVLNLNAEDGGNRQFILVEMEEYAESITAERVKRVIQQEPEKQKDKTQKSIFNKSKNTKSETVKPIGFSFYELGEMLLDEDNFLNEKAEIADIRAYIWYTETGENYQAGHHPEIEINPYLLGEYFGRSYYFHYEKAKVTHLDYEFLATIKHQSESYLIYADVCYLSDEFLEKHRITFKKIPRDISRL